MTTIEFTELCKILIIQRCEGDSVVDIHLVWFSKVLQNMKAILVDNGDNKRVYEITYNGSKKEIYLDCYAKEYNHVIEASNEKRTT